MAKSLDEIFDSDDFGLLDAKPVRSYVQTDEDRLIESFEEINVFYEKNNREPSTASMSEYSLQARLKAIRDNEKTKGMLKSFDRHNLLGEVEVKPQSIEDILENDDLDLLGAEGDNSIFNFIHTPKPGSRADAEYIAQRKPMSEREFKKYEVMFKQVHRELKEGKRKLLPFNDAERNLLEGNFYLVDGLLAYLEVSNAEKVLKENESGDRIRLEGRTLTIFENGTLSNMLFRSLGKAIQKNGKMITNTEEHIEKQLFKNSGIETTSKESVQSGWIYILKSKSNDPQIQNIDNLYKIGFSKTPVEQRIKNASKEATYLNAEVEEIAAYRCENINIQALENLLHRFFAEACLNIDIYDNSGNRSTPREWFVVPLKLIDEAIQLVQNETIVNYRYDNQSKSITLKGNSGKTERTKENTLYLPIKQLYFDQIISGEKKEEYREIKMGITANRYLLRDNKGKYIINEKVADKNKDFYVDDYNNGSFPFMPKPYKYLHLAVGYKKDRDTAIVEVVDYSFVPNMIRSNLYAFWQIVYHLGEVIEVNRST